MIFPGDDYTAQWSAQTNNIPLPGVAMFPLIVGCITYDFFPDKLNCQTSFVYAVGKPGNMFGLIFDADEIPGEGLSLTRMPFAGIAT